MRALVITAYPPLRKGVELAGTHLRFRLFVEAIGKIADNIEFVHLVRDRFIAANPDIDVVAARQSAYFRLPISMQLVKCQEHRRTTLINHYLSGIPSAHKQDDFFWCSGSEQAAAVGAALDRSPDVVLVHRLGAMLSVLRSARRPARMFFDLDDVEHRRRVQHALTPIRPGTLGYLCQIPAVAAAEWRGSMLSRSTFVCSEVDRARLRRLGFPRIAVVPNALTAPSEPPEVPRTPTILFLGSLWYSANSGAAERLILRIFPRIRAVVPNARLVIAGNGSLELPSRTTLPAGVEYLGYVKDLPALYASARLVCCPITIGSGTRLKLIEAAGYARPTVATKFAAEGLDFRDGIEIILRDSDEEIAEQCVRLTRDDNLCRSIGAAARMRMRERYDASAIQESIVRVMSNS